VSELNVDERQGESKRLYNEENDARGYPEEDMGKWWEELKNVSMSYSCGSGRREREGKEATERASSGSREGRKGGRARIRKVFKK